MKKKTSTSKVKKGPLGTPLGNPIGYFNSKKSLVKKQNGGGTEDPEYLAYKAQKQAAADKKRDTEFTPGQQGKFMGSGMGKIPYDLWQLGAKSPMNKYYKENPKEKTNPDRQYYNSDGEGGYSKAPNPNDRFGYFSENEQKYMDAYDAQENFNNTLPEKLQEMLPYKKGGSITKGSQLRRQASTSGLRTNRKHK